MQITKKNSAKILQKNSKKIFRIGSIAPLTIKKNSRMFLRAAPAMIDLGFSVKILAIGDEFSQKKSFALAENFPGKFEILEQVSKNEKKIWSSSDALIFPFLPEKNILKKIIKNGIVPILPENKFLENFDPQRESGAAFTFSPQNFWEFVAAIVRASENFRFSYDWKNLQKNLQKIKI